MKFEKKLESASLVGFRDLVGHLRRECNKFTLTCTDYPIRSYLHADLISIKLTHTSGQSGAHLPIVSLWRMELNFSALCNTLGWPLCLITLYSCTAWIFRLMCVWPFYFTMERRSRLVYWEEKRKCWPRFSTTEWLPPKKRCATKFVHVPQESAFRKTKWRYFKLPRP